MKHSVNIHKVKLIFQKVNRAFTNKLNFLVANNLSFEDEQNKRDKKDSSFKPKRAG